MEVSHWATQELKIHDLKHWSSSTDDATSDRTVLDNPACFRRRALLSPAYLLLLVFSKHQHTVTSTDLSAWCRPPCHQWLWREKTSSPRSLQSGWIDLLLKKPLWSWITKPTTLSLFIKHSEPWIRHLYAVKIPRQDGDGLTWSLWFCSLCAGRLFCGDSSLCGTCRTDCRPPVERIIFSDFIHIWIDCCQKIVQHK